MSEREQGDKIARVFKPTSATDNNNVALVAGPCEIVHELTCDEADIDDVGAMYLIRMSNGVIAHAFADELS